MGESKTQLEDLLERLKDLWKKGKPGDTYELILDNFQPLMETESNYLIGLGQQFFKNGQANRMWDIAKIYSKGMGYSSESLHFESGCELKENTLLFGMVRTSHQVCISIQYRGLNFQKP